MNETDYNARLYEKMKADWQEDGVKVSKGAKSLSILEPVEYANRSIQAEGAFGQLKHNRNFKRFLTGGKVKVLAELLFLGLSQNIAHLLAKCNSGLQNLHLIQPKAYLNF